MGERWGLIIEEPRYGGRYEPRVVGEFTGTREEAMVRLEQLVAEYEGGNEYSSARRRLFRTGDGFLSVHGNGVLTSGVRFSVAEVVRDSNDAKEAAAAAKRAEKERRAAERKARREQRRMVIEDDDEDDEGEG
jgi:hypothetical protein